LVWNHDRSYYWRLHDDDHLALPDKFWSDIYLNTKFYSKHLATDRELIIFPTTMISQKCICFGRKFSRSAWQWISSTVYRSWSSATNYCRGHLCPHTRTLQLVPPLCLLIRQPESPPGTADVFRFYGTGTDTTRKVRSSLRLFAKKLRKPVGHVFLIYKPDLFTGRLVSHSVAETCNLLVTKVGEFSHKNKWLHSCMRALVPWNWKYKKRSDELTGKVTESAYRICLHTYLTPGVDHQLNAKFCNKWNIAVGKLCSEAKILSIPLPEIS
jgi:hypothetical protein